MSEPTVAVAIAGATSLQIVTTFPGAIPNFSYVDLKAEKPLRRALNARHKERKAAKKAERRFALARSTKPGEWWVMDCEDNDHVVAIFPKSNSAEADARATSKMLNKRNLKPMGGEA